MADVLFDFVRIADWDLKVCVLSLVRLPKKKSPDRKSGERMRKVGALVLLETGESVTQCWLM
jgi:hypothetical protein